MRAKSTSRARLLWSWLRRAFRFLGLSIAIYIGVIVIGLMPVNNDFRPATDGIEIFVVSNPVHADLVLPINAEGVDWRETFPSKYFAVDTSQATHISIGWGDKGFYIQTATWADLRPSVAANALLLPSDACIHVGMTKSQWLQQDAKSTKISPEQYHRLAKHIQETLKFNDDGSSIVIAGESYGKRDAFFEAHGNYHLLNTCNSWAGRGLKASGIRTCWISPMPKTPCWYFPEHTQEHEKSPAE